MLKLAKDVKVFVCLTPEDMRKSINGLSGLVVEELGGELTSGDIYLFFNKSRDRVKGLYWDKNGFVLHHKRLEKHKFVLPPKQEVSALEISEVQLHGLFAGLDFMLMKQFNDIDYTTIF